MQTSTEVTIFMVAVLSVYVLVRMCLWIYGAVNLQYGKEKEYGSPTKFRWTPNSDYYKDLDPVYVIFLCGRHPMHIFLGAFYSFVALVILYCFSIYWHSLIYFGVLGAITFMYWYIIMQRNKNIQMYEVEQKLGN